MQPGRTPEKVRRSVSERSAPEDRRGGDTCSCSSSFVEDAYGWPLPEAAAPTLAVFESWPDADTLLLEPKVQLRAPSDSSGNVLCSP
ncbi:hypothetical protein MTO96_013583 [Rhipicephalus appendiculatus]